MNFKLNPTIRLVIILSLLALGAIYKNLENWQALGLHLISTLGFGIILFYIFKAITGKPKNIWNTVITSLIIFLVLNHGGNSEASLADISSIIYALAATFIAIASKFFLEPRGMPIINPTVLGLLAVYIIGKWILGYGGPFISWWGVAYNLYYIPLILMALWALWGLKSWNKWAPVLSFLLVVLATAYPVFGSWETVKFIFTDATIYFFATIMLVDPKSSPLLKKQQIFFGIIAAAVYQTLLYFHIPHYDLIAILCANLYFWGTKMFMLKKAANRQPNDIKNT
ncbi:MAG: hypothetical protein AAB373_06710 [Patescibacteria group bacterium]